MKRRHRAVSLEAQALRETMFTGPPDRKDKRWDRKCNYCMIALRKHYTYDHAKRHAMCPNCHKAEAKEVKKVDGDVKPEVCPIKRPKPRELGKLRRVYVSGRNPRPFENAKWSTLKEWAEQLRDRHERKGEFLTVGGLLNLAYRAAPNYDKGAKAANRLKDLYRKEWAEWTAGMQSVIDDAIRREREAEEKRRRMLEEKQRARSRDELSPVEQRVLDVLSRFAMSKAEIRTASRVKKVNAPLKKLVKLGLAAKVGGRYRLPRKKKSKKTGGKSRV